MMFPRLAPAVGAVAALSVATSGCAHVHDPSPKEKVKAALTRLNDDPDTYYFESFIARSPVTGQLSQQVLVLVPPKGGTGFKIVDSRGEIFDDYTDFLRNNTLPDQPGPTPATR